jgi:riboflavin kinase/FMN adenylyltransferase
LIAAMDRDSKKARALIAGAKPVSNVDERLGFFG